MTIQSVKKFEEILMYLSILRYIFKSRSKRGLYDLNKKSESFFKNLFNLIYSWNLVDLNKIKNNYPAIDLGDQKKKICIQITAENRSTKINNTLKKFIKHKFYLKYERLVIFILTDKKNYSKDFETKGKIDFDKLKDIWDIDDVLADVEELNIDALTTIHEFLKKELSSIIKLFAEKGSILAQIEKFEGKLPKSCNKFFNSFQFDDDLIEIGNETILNLYNKLISLSKRSREYLFLLIDRATIEKVCGGEHLYVLPADIENYSGLDCDEHKEEFQILELHGLAYFENNEYPPRIEIDYSMDCTYGENLFSLFKQFFEDDSESLENLIIDCNFSLLNA